MDKTGIHPCICVSPEPSPADSVYCGMPQLKVYADGNGRPLYTAVCPVCGRGGYPDRKTAETAIADWNKMQDQLWEMNGGKPLGDAPKNKEHYRHGILHHYSFAESYIMPFSSKEEALNYLKLTAETEYQSDMLNYDGSEMEMSDDGTYARLTVLSRSGEYDVTEYEYVELPE